MSSILKALKKLEQEKIARPPGAPVIDAEILRGPEAGPCPTSRLLRGTITAVLVFICGGMAVYAYLNGFSRSAKKEQSSPSMAELEKSIAAETPAVASPRNRSGNHGTRERLPVSSLAAKTGTPLSVQGKPKPKTVLSSTPDAATNPYPDRGERQAQQPDAVEAFPVLSVSGIAFQPEGGDSVAIVNGNQVTSGAMVSGATVGEIFRDRVRFNYKGESVEVLLGRSNR